MNDRLRPDSTSRPSGVRHDSGRLEMPSSTRLSSSLDALFSIDADTLLAVGASFRSGVGRARASFECTLSRSSEHAGFAVFAGLDPLLDTLESSKLHASDVLWLLEQAGLDTSRAHEYGDPAFACDISAPPEGTIVFPGAPVMTIEGPYWQVLILSALASRHLELATNVATRVARAMGAAPGMSLVEFGSGHLLDARAAAFLARAAYIGGATATTSLAGKRAYQVPLSARASTSRETQSHGPADYLSWLSSLPDEAVVALNDTADEHALEEFLQAIAQRGGSLGLELPVAEADRVLSCVNARFPARDLSTHFGEIPTELNLLETVREFGDVDGYRMDCVRKKPLVQITGNLVAIEEDGRWAPRLSATVRDREGADPGRKILVRYLGPGNAPMADVAHATNERIQAAKHLQYVHKATGKAARATAERGTPLFVQQMRAGRRAAISEPVLVARDRARLELSRLPMHYKRLLTPPRYPIGLSPSLMDEKQRLLDEQERE
jgi:nicotinate phosphoribosyltransferase